jgi:hypothetical protein
LNLLGYYLFGLAGLGISFMIGYLLYLVQVYVVSHVKFSFVFNNSFKKIFVFQLSLAVTSFLVVKYLSDFKLYLIGLILIFLSSWFSFKELDERLGVKTIMIDLKNKFLLKK